MATTARRLEDYGSMGGKGQEAADLEGRATGEWAEADRRHGAHVPVSEFRALGFVPGPHCDESNPAEWAGEPVDPLDN